MATHLNNENFETEVLNSDLPVLVDFFATWCGPCQMLSPTIEEIAGEADGFEVGKVDIDESPELAQKYGIMSVPTLLVIKDGKETARSVGAIPKAQILDMLK